MAYKIKWATGGETAERYSSKTLAHAILKERNLTGRVLKTKLIDPGKTLPSTKISFGGRVEKFPSGKRLVWQKIRVNVKGVHGIIYRTSVQ